MSGRFPVSGAILNWLPKYSGKGYEAFYKRFPKYGEWIAGSVHPTICQIQALATFSNVPLGYIYLKLLSRYASLLILTIISNKYVWSL